MSLVVAPHAFQAIARVFRSCFPQTCSGPEFTRTFEAWIPHDAGGNQAHRTQMDQWFCSTLGLKPLRLVFQYNIYRATGQSMSPWYLQVQAKNSDKVTNIKEIQRR